MHTTLHCQLFSMLDGPPSRFPTCQSLTSCPGQVGGEIEWSISGMALPTLQTWQSLPLLWFYSHPLLEMDPLPMIQPFKSSEYFVFCPRYWSMFKWILYLYNQGSYTYWIILISWRKILTSFDGWTRCLNSVKERRS